VLELSQSVNVLDALYFDHIPANLWRNLPVLTMKSYAWNSGVTLNFLPCSHIV